jgi:von Willebrand factor type A domain/Aerotolerance regulator N-terminal
MKWLLRNWFLFGLIVLALCALPGVILVILRLFNADAAINQWLLANFSITCELRVPPWLAVVLLFLPILLVILYFLRLKRKPIQVPSTFLWKKSIEDLHVNSLFQWLRNNVLLLLQLLVLLFLIYSVLGVRIHGGAEKSNHFILLIDNSASMSVKDVAPSRLEWAKAQALLEIDAAGPHDVGMVIVFNSKATTVQAYTSDQERLRDAVRGIEQTQRTTHIVEALMLAASLANPQRSTEDASMQPSDVVEEQRRTLVRTPGIQAVVHLYSDGRFAKLTEAELKSLNLRMGEDERTGGFKVRYHRAGAVAEKPGNVNNLAIVGFNAIRQLAPSKKNAAQRPPQYLAFVRLANFRAKEASVKVKLEVFVEGERRHVLETVAKLPARVYVAGEGDKEEKDEPGEESADFVLPLIEARRNIMLHAYLDQPNDDFALDDQAWLVLGTTRKARVLIVGKANAFFDAFFNMDATKRIAIAERMAPDDLPTESYRKKARSGEFDLVVFDRCAPADEADLPLANTYFIDQPPPPWQRGDKTLKNPLMMPSKLNDLLLKDVTTIGEIRADHAFVFDVNNNLDPNAAAEVKLPDSDAKRRVLPTITRIVEASNQTPMLFTMARGPHTDLVQTFALTSDDGGLPSNWGLQISFPLFFRNVLHILGNVDDSVRSISVQPGEPVVLRPEAGFRFVELTMPGREKFKIERTDRNEIVFADTEKVGVYRYTVIEREGDGTEPLRGFAVNLLDANESNIEPRLSVRFGGEPIVAGAERKQTHEIWKWILLLAVVLLLIEWLIYHRRIAV